MLNLAIWKKAFDHPSLAGELAFVAGLRHFFEKKNYCPIHAHQVVEIVYHPTGQGNTCVSGQPLFFNEGSVVVYAPGEPHDQTISAGGEDLCVQISIGPRLRHKLKSGFYIARINRPWITEEIRHLCRNRAQPDGWEQRVFDLRATAVLLALVNIATAVSKQNTLSSAQRHVLLAEQFISEHFSTLQSLEEVSHHVGISHDHLRHVFRKLRQRSLIRYLNEVKIERAKTLLASSPLPLKQIATMCGFRDEYYFSAVFHRLANLAPGLYRRKVNDSI